MTYKLYSAAIRSRLAIRAPYLEAASNELDKLKAFGCWKYQPAVITDEDGRVIEDNGVNN